LGQDDEQNPMEWSEPSLVEYEFKFGAKQRAGLARLGFPRLREGDSEWSCAFQIKGLKDSRIRLARGADGLQALTIASTVIRKSLDRLEIVAADVVPHEIIFPRYVPFCQGLEHHRNLCKILDAEIKEINRQLARRRRGRKKPS
jgi:hypothetical protein